MTQDLVDKLNKKEVPKDLEALADAAKGDMKRSRGEMCKYYPQWDLQDSVYRGEMPADADDRDRERKGQPTKMVTPNTFAQVMTFTSFLFLMFNQNRTFFELNPTGQEDHGTKKVDSETLLEQNLRQNQWNGVLFQNLLDIGRFGPGILECSWTRQVTKAYVPQAPTLINYQGVESTVRGGSEWQDFVKYEGNLVRPVSPYRFFPDPSRPLTEFQRGNFCGSEEDYTMGELYDLQAAGEVAGVEHIEGIPKDFQKLRGGETRSASFVETRGRYEPQSGFDATNRSHNVLVSKVQKWIVPSKFEIDEHHKKKLGPEEHQVLYHLWYANDGRLIRAEPAVWWHNSFGWTVSQFTPDMHRTVNLGLADLVYKLQDVINWFINSHVSSVRRVMQNRLIINPQIIDTTSLDGEGDIYMRKGVGSRAVSDGAMQLKVQDVTSGHMSDVDMLSKIMQIVTGVNDNAMGQYNSGRRSAQEARVVTAGAAGRMKLHGHLIFEAGLSPLAKMMLSNLRQGISEYAFNSVIGEAAKSDPLRYQTFKGTPEEVICGCDYFTFDSTLASEKGFIAQSLQELIGIILSNPLVAQQLDLDPRAMIEEMQLLRGAGPIGRFSLSKRIATGVASPLPPMPVPGPAAAAV